MTQSANERQVGGSHYQNKKIQHWDLMKRFQVGYFEGQITKYSERHTRKDGRQALLKSIHFCEKMIEDIPPEARANVGEFDVHHFALFVSQGELDAKQIAIYALALTWRGRREAERLLLMLRDYDAEYYGEAEGSGDSSAPPSDEPRCVAEPFQRPGTPEDGGHHDPLLRLGARVRFLGSSLPDRRILCQGRSGVVRMVQQDRDGDLSCGVLWDGVRYRSYSDLTRHPAEEVEVIG